MKIILYIILLTFFVFNVRAEIIKDIKINGNQRISQETISVLGNISLNEDYSEIALNKILKNLYDSNFFKNISINILNNVLIIDVIENPIIEDIEITGIKNKSIIDNLTENISLKSRASYNEDQLNADINLIKNILKSNGYFFANIKSSIVKNKELNSIELTINVELGEKAKVKNFFYR